MSLNIKSERIMKRILTLLALPLLLAACGGNSGSHTDATPAIFNIGPAALPDAVEGIAYSAQLSAPNGMAPVTFDWAVGYTPPAWLSLSLTGEVTGVPAGVGMLNLEVIGTDAASKTATRTIALKVVAPARITTAVLARAIRGQPYTNQLTHNATAPAFAVTSANLPAGISFSATGEFSGTPTAAGLFEVAVEMTVGGIVHDTATFDLIVDESIPYTYTEDSLEPNDTRGTGTQLFAGNTPPGLLTMADRHVQADPLTLNSNLNIPKPDGDDYFRFNTATVGEIKIEVFFRFLVGEIDACLWYYTGPPTHEVLVVADSVRVNQDDELIVLPNAQPGFYYLQITAPGDANLGLWSRNAYTFRVTFNDLTVPTELLEADSAAGPVDVAAAALNQGAATTGNWTLVSGTPPNGVTFNANGHFSGTPTEFGLYTFTVQVQDSGLTATRDIKVRFYDSAAGDYWQIKGERRKYDPANGNPIWATFGDAMVVAPHPSYPTEGAIYVLGGFEDSGLDNVRVFHTDRAGIPTDKQFKFEDISKPLPNQLRYHAAGFVQHTYGGYIYVAGGEIGVATGLHGSGDFWGSVFRLQVADGTGAALAHPLAGAWEQIAEMPSSEGPLNILGWGEGGVAITDAAADADDRIYFVGGRYQVEDSVGAGTYTKKFHNAVLMLECPTSAVGAGAWHRKAGAVTYTPRRFPAVSMINGRIYIAAGREGAPGQSGSGSTISTSVEMYQPSPAGTAQATATATSASFPQIGSQGGYYPMYATMSGALYIWCGWDSNFVGTRALHRFEPNAQGNGGTMTRLTDADWGTGFGAGVAHDGKLWILSGIGHGTEALPNNLRYTP
jgi:hypothetical protein